VIRKLWIAAQALAAGVVLIYVAGSIAGNWVEIRGLGRAMRFDAGALAAAAAVILLTYALLIGAWRAVLLGWGERLRYPAAARIWTVSNLARYVPGRIWQIAGMAAMAQQAGVSPWAAAGSAIIVQLLAVATGALVTALFAPGIQNAAAIAVAAAVSVAGVLALTHPRTTELLASAFHRLSGRQLQLKPVAAGPLLLSAAVTAFAWVAYGVALYFLAKGLLASSGLDLPTAIGSFTGSYLLGLIFVFTPGGLGIREGAILLLLTGPIGPAAAAVVSLGSRILMTGTELLAALIALPLEHRRTE